MLLHGAATKGLCAIGSKPHPFPTSSFYALQGGSVGPVGRPLVHRESLGLSPADGLTPSQKNQVSAFGARPLILATACNRTSLTYNIHHDETSDNSCRDLCLCAIGSQDLE